MDNILIEPMKAEDAAALAELIRRNLEVYEEAGSVLAATFRRLDSLFKVYSGLGAKYFVAKDMDAQGKLIGGAGLGPLHGLPPSEGMGEVRDLVLEKTYRGRGIGTRLLRRCLDESREFGYSRLYLETTPQMEKAQKLFVRFGFRAITQGGAPINKAEKMPCYFVYDSP